MKHTWKKILAFVTVCALALAIMVPSAMAAQGDYTTFEFADVTGGQIRGYKWYDVYTFLGIPYAQAERFEEPQDPAWDGLLDCLVPGPIAPQDIAYQKAGDSSDFTEYAGTDQHETENCLNLNVWTKSMDPDAKKPVIVWYHGGGYSSGSSIEGATYDGRNLADYGDVVFVSVNARLNVLGYLDLSAYGEEYAHTGNLGMMDNAKALEWVNKNITTFGGDPENVTIIGQSGGGGKVMTLMGMPSAAGYFQKVWAMSGSQTTGRDPEVAKEDGTKLVEYLGLQDEADPVAILKEMRYDDLCNACSAAGVDAGGPVNDGEIYLGTVIDGEYTELAQSYPLIISSVFSEMSGNTQKMLFENRMYHSMDEWLSDDPMEELINRYEDYAEPIAEAFQKAYPSRDLTDALYINSGRSNEIAIAKANSGGNVWQAVFAYKLPVAGGFNSWHTGGDIPFLFHNADKEGYLIAGDEENAYAYQDVCADALIAYAYTGDPSTDSLAWPQFTVENGETMVFDNDSYVGNYHDQELLALIEEAPKPASSSGESAAEEAEAADDAEDAVAEGTADDIGAPADYTQYKIFDGTYGFGDAEIMAATNDDQSIFYITFVCFDEDQILEGTIEDGIVNVNYDLTGFVAGDAQLIWDDAVASDEPWIVR